MSRTPPRPTARPRLDCARDGIIIIPNAKPLLVSAPALQILYRLGDHHVCEGLMALDGVFDRAGLVARRTAAGVEVDVAPAKEAAA